MSGPRGGHHRRAAPEGKAEAPQGAAGDGGAGGKPAGLWQPLLWESEHLLQAEVLARLAALGVDTGTAVPEALPAAKHIFSHIEWLLSGVALTVPEQAAPAGCAWASREELRTTYTLPGAFAAYKDRMLE